MKIPYGKQHITEEDIAEVVKTLRADLLTQGPMIESFEKKFADFLKTDYVLAVSNGTTALHLAMLALGVKVGSKVISTGNTFAATSNAVLYCGGEVVFADINPHTFLIDEDSILDILEKNPPGTFSGIAAVSFAGYPVQLEKMRKIADAHNLWIVEDACHAPGAKFKADNGEWIKSGSGNYSDIAVFSFHPVKHLCGGEGGAVATKRLDLYEKMQLLRTHGITKNPHDYRGNNHRPAWYHEMQELGYNYRITDIQCALLQSQLNRIENNLKRRNEIAKFYDENLSIEKYGLPYREENVFHAFHLYVIQSSRRDEVYLKLQAKGVHAQVHYIPVYQHPYYQETFGVIKNKNNDYYFERCLSIPMYHAMTDVEVEYVVKILNEI